MHGICTKCLRRAKHGAQIPLEGTYACLADAPYRMHVHDRFDCPAPPWEHTRWWNLVSMMRHVVSV